MSKKMSRNKRSRAGNANRAVANRANAQQSTGPITSEGKAIASQNALRHGLTSKKIVLPGENPAEYESQRERLYREFHPNTETERTLVDELAACAWRLARARSVETAAYTKLVANHPDPAEALAEILIDRPKEIANIQRYVTSFERAYYRALNKLTSIRKQQTSDATSHEANGFVSQNDEEEEPEESEGPEMEAYIDASIAQMEAEIRYFQRCNPDQDLQP